MIGQKHVMLVLYLLVEILIFTYLLVLTYFILNLYQCIKLIKVKGHLFICKFKTVYNHINFYQGLIQSPSCQTD